jgi:2-C-methyl-D-erythritol 4-phosphate cytidylyltransferase
MDKVAVIVAGGSGTRMGAGMPKQFLVIQGKPILVHTINAFYSAFQDIKIILVLPVDYMQRGTDLIKRFYPGKRISITEGGASRFESVKKGLSIVSSPSVIFVHDAVRCLVSTSLIHLCYDTALESGSAIPVIPVKDSIRKVIGSGSEVVDRETLRAVQTPQTFRSDLLLPAFNAEYHSSFTDEATVVEHSGISVTLVEGEELNIKLTYPADFDFAEQALSRKISNDWLSSGK